MTEHEVAKKVMKDSGTTQVQIAEAVGMKSQGAVGNWLQGKSMRVDNLVRLLDVCGYDLIVRDRNGKLPTYRISNEEGLDIVDDVVATEPDRTDYEEIARRVVIEELKLRGL